MRREQNEWHRSTALPDARESVHRIEAEVVDDEEVDGDQLAELGLVAVVVK